MLANDATSENCKKISLLTSGAPQSQCVHWETEEAEQSDILSCLVEESN
jgi:hypothetical protein